MDANQDMKQNGEESGFHSIAPETSPVAEPAETPPLAHCNYSCEFAYIRG
jgi:hypothetical protein